MTKPVSNKQRLVNRHHADPQNRSVTKWHTKMKFTKRTHFVRPHKPACAISLAAVQRGGALNGHGVTIFGASFPPPIESWIAQWAESKESGSPTPGGGAHDTPSPFQGEGRGEGPSAPPDGKSASPDRHDPQRPAVKPFGEAHPSALLGLPHADLERVCEDAVLELTRLCDRGRYR